MNDIITYYTQRIKGMEDANREMREENDQLRQYIFDLLDEDTPDEYKEVIRHEVFGTKIRYNYES
jgi:hypothetical protein